QELPGRRPGTAAGAAGATAAPEARRAGTLPPVAAGARRGTVRDLPGDGSPARPADGGAASGARVGAGRPAFRSRGLHHVLPAFAVPVDAKPHPADVPTPPIEGSRHSPVGPGPGPGGRRAGAIPIDPPFEDRGAADPVPRRLPPGPGPLYGP